MGDTNKRICMLQAVTELFKEKRKPIYYTVVSQGCDKFV